MKMHYERADYFAKDPDEAVLLNCTFVEKPSELNLEIEKRGRYILLWAKPAVFERVVSVLGPDIALLYLNCCPRITDLTPLESLPNLRYIYIHWNQKATALWDMSRNPRLEEVSLAQFNRLSDLRDLETAPHLQALRLDGGVDKKWKVKSFGPLSSMVSLKMLLLFELLPAEGGFGPLQAMRWLRYMRLSHNILPVDDYARLAAALPETECQAFEGVWPYSYGYQNEAAGEQMRTISMITLVGKGRHELNADHPGAQEKAERYRRDFAAKVREYRQEMAEAGRK